MTNLKDRLSRAVYWGKLLLLVGVGLLTSSAAMAQQAAAADSAIDVARQWLSLADANQAARMWEQSNALMKAQSDQKSWITYIDSMHSQFGPTPDSRFWQALEHQLDHPSLPRGEFASVTFVSGYAKARAWEKVALVWQDQRWVPVGYQYGPLETIGK
ncbi:DUF4019 domain-containing protein [Collimonas pratensis]|uniref:DUF4019 domain-containing protein n=1 Tax=Collimonas pratensis TaxID=279113 RepID=UPI00143CF055|nr:DUF4019 domain-containing protein [Collimonas pratensis]NKI72708.1 DUF4019 domain-containing protein [Collimonas pratensis]